VTTQVHREAPGAEILHAFDRFAQRHVGADALTQTAASLAGCSAGVSDRSGRAIARCDAAGRSLPLAMPDGSERRPYGRDGVPGGVAWLEPGQPLEPEQRLVLDRFAFTLGCQASSDAAVPFTRRTEALEALLRGDAGEVERATAARALSLDMGEHVRVVWVVSRRRGRGGSDDLIRRLRSASDDVLRWLRIDGRLLILVRDADLHHALDAIPQRGFTVAIGPAERASAASSSLAGASVALRFAGHAVGPGTVRYDDLGTLAALLDVAPGTVRSSPEVAAVKRMAADRDGLGDLRCLEAFLRLGSLRAAARELFLHHSSVASRLDRAFCALALDRERPLHRCRAQLALALWMTSTKDDEVSADLGPVPDTCRGRRHDDATNGRSPVRAAS
jgi:hypothetical protein